ncbi:MAG: type II toxin-antitoxin system RelE/ParE family toxin [Magnetococcales bacterium]|nr:type II toxin-antitoxin system RelE/ParE family toxin [Magnetococcales bacterium]
MNWRVEYLNLAVQEEIDSWPTDMRAKLARIIDLIEDFGLHHVREPYVRHSQDKLWEMRVRGDDDVARAIYVMARARRIIILHAFRKKTQKTPDRAIRLARERMKELDP